MRGYTLDKKLSDTIGTAETARILRCSESRVKLLIGSGRLPAKPIGDRWALSRQTVEEFRALPKLPAGRPAHRPPREGAEQGDSEQNGGESGQISAPPAGSKTPRRGHR